MESWKGAWGEVRWVLVREWEWPMVMAEADQMHRKHDLENVDHFLETHCRGDLSNCPRRLLCGTQGCPCHDVEESTRGGGWDFGHHTDDLGTSGTSSGWCWVGFWSVCASAGCLWSVLGPLSGHIGGARLRGTKSIRADSRLSVIAIQPEVAKSLLFPKSNLATKSLLS